MLIVGISRWCFSFRRVGSRCGVVLLVFLLSEFGIGWVRSSFSVIVFGYCVVGGRIRREGCGGR